MTMPAAISASTSSGVAAAPPKKHRQTRIPEHLKAVKKGSSSSSSSASSTSSSSALKLSLAKALRTASTPKKSEKHSAAAAVASENNGASPRTGLVDVSHAHSVPLASPAHAVQEQWVQQAPARSDATPSRTPMTSPHRATSARPAVNTQASILSMNCASPASSSPTSARLPYAFTNDRTNELAASLDRSALYSSLQSMPTYQQQFQQQRQSTVSKPSTSTSTMALDSTLLARSCSSASSMAYSQPDFTFSTAPSSQSLSSSSSAFTHPSFDSSSSSAYGHVQLPVWPCPSNNNSQMTYVQSPSAMQTSSSNASLASLQQQQQDASFGSSSTITPARTKRSYTSLSNMSSSSSSSAAILGNSVPLSSSSIMSKSVTRSGSSPRSPSTPFSKPLILSISSNGKACLTSPQKSKRATSLKSNTPKALVAAAMLRSSTTTNTVKTPARQTMMRSNTTDPRMSTSQGLSYSQKREVSELNGVGRVVGQGKMFDLHDESRNNGMTFSTTLPQSLNLDIEMDLAAGMGVTGYPSSSYSQVSYPYFTYPPNGAILTPPQSAEMGKKALPYTTSNRHGLPLYPEKERFQSSWKFPSGTGLNLHTSGQSMVPGSTSASTASSSPSSVVTSSFPSMHSLNTSIVNVMKGNESTRGLASSPIVKSPIGAVSQDMSRRQSRIQAWLDSPDLQDEEVGSSWSSLPSRNGDTDSSSARPPTASSSSGFSISPASIMTRTASEVQMSSAAVDQEYEEVEVMRASGKSIRPLKISKKRRMLGDEEEDEQGDGSLSTKDKNAIKAGLGMPFQAIASSRQATPTPDAASPRKRIRSNDNKDDETDQKGRKGRQTKKKGPNICSCGTGDDGEAMIQCDECSCWFHLACVGVDEGEIPERWFCTPCVKAPAAAQELNAPATYPSAASSTMHNQLEPSPSTQQTPKRPGLTREPTFSKTATPKIESARHFDDAPLVAQSSVRPGAIPSTPQSNTVQYNASHSHNASLSRNYAPVTPRVGFPGHVSAPGTQYQWDTYSPHTPSNAIAHSRRLSRQHQYLNNTPSTNWSHVTQWEELPSSVSRREPDESERTKQWEQFYNAPPPASINPIPMTPPLASHSAFTAAESFLPSLEQEASVSQRFLAIHSTPSQWTDTARFADNVW